MRTRRAWVSIIVVCLFLQSVALANVQLGDQTFGTRKTRALRVDGSFKRASKAVRAPRFLRGVGGVAFGAIARPAGVKPKRLALDYDASRADGGRVVVTFSGEDFELPVADWILVPAAEFADQDDIALVTAFGDYADQEATTDERRCNFIFSYHPAIEGRLIGLRLMQADLFGITDRFALLPSDETGVLLGTGEVEPSRDDYATWYAAHRATLAEVQGTYTSYLLTDADREITFALATGELTLAGGPVYLTWSNGLRSDGTATLEASYQAFVQRLIDERRTTAWVGAHARTLGKQVIKAARARLKAELAERKAAGLESRAHRERAQAHIADLEKWTKTARSSRAAAEDRVIALFMLEYEAKANLVDVGTADHAMNDPERIRAANPVVYDAATRFSQVTAFFRYIRTKHKKAWARFKTTIAGARVATMTLPTELPRDCEHTPDQVSPER